jgi:hypothetical protein
MRLRFSLFVKFEVASVHLLLVRWNSVHWSTSLKVMEAPADVKRGNDEFSPLTGDQCNL